MSTNRRRGHSAACRACHAEQNKNERRRNAALAAVHDDASAADLQMPHSDCDGATNTGAEAPCRTLPHHTHCRQDQIYVAPNHMFPKPLTSLVGCAVIHAQRGGSQGAATPTDMQIVVSSLANTPHRIQPAASATSVQADEAPALKISERRSQTLRSDTARLATLSTTTTRPWTDSVDDYN